MSRTFSVSSTASGSGSPFLVALTASLPLSGGQSNPAPRWTPFSSTPSPQPRALTQVFSAPPACARRAAPRCARPGVRASRCRPVDRERTRAAKAPPRGPRRGRGRGRRAGRRGTSSHGPPATARSAQTAGSPPARRVSRRSAPAFPGRKGCRRRCRRTPTATARDRLRGRRTPCRSTARRRGLVLDVPEEPIGPAPLAEVLLPLPAPGSPLRPGEAGGLAQLYRRPARSSRDRRAVEERRHFGVVARPIDADVVAALAERGRILGAPEERDAPPQGNQVVGAGQLARRIDIAAVSLRGRVSGDPERGGERGRSRQIEGADAALYGHARSPAAPGEPDGARQARRSGSPRHAGLDEDGLRATRDDVDGKRVPLFAVDGVSDRDQGVRPFAGCALWPGRMLENDGGDAIQVVMRLVARAGGQAGARALHHQLRSDALATGGDKTDARGLGRGRRG